MKYLLSTALLLACFLIVSARTLRVISGKIMDEQGAPIASAAVKCSNGHSYNNVCNAKSDIHGNYSITFPGKIPTTLVFSAVGYVTKEVEISHEDILNVTLSKN